MEIPKEVKSVIEKLKSKGFEAYVVGGCVRDFLLARRSEDGIIIEPQDWDITTNAKPKEIQKIFPNSFYKNKFFTVTVQTGSENPKLKEIEITTYRLETKYTDKRHPSEVKFAKTLKEDLARRDFTVNAMALNLESRIKKGKSRKKDLSFVVDDLSLTLVDPFGGQKDLENKIIRAVGNPEKRFSEDALRMMRAVRFAVKLNSSAAWQIEGKTAQAIKENSIWLQAISKERVRDEFVKIIMTEKAAEGIEILRTLELLRYIIPELEEGYGVSQNKHHIYDCYEHSLRSLGYAAKRNFNKYVRISALLHDIGKPRTKRGKGLDATFYGHEIVGARITLQILNRLRFSKRETEKIAKLVRYHLFYYTPEEVGESSVRRLVRQVGPENMEELIQVRMADRIGSGVPKAEPYKLRHLKYVIEKVSQDPISSRMLKVNGKDVMGVLKIKEGPKIGHVLNILLSLVLDDPKKNKRDLLEKEIKELGKLTEEKFSSLAEKARQEVKKIETKRDKMTKKKYWVT